MSKNKSVEELNPQITCGPFGSNLTDTLYQEKGVLVVRPFNLKELKIENNNLVYVSKNTIDENNLKLFNQDTIIFARVGDMKIGIADVDNFTISPNIIALEIKQKDMVPMLGYFFYSYYGMTQLIRELKISAQPTISTEIIQNLKIPAFSNTLLQHFKENRDKTKYYSIKSEQLYNDAETLLLQELDLTNWQPTNESSTQKSFADFLNSGRLDAEYYQPKYDELFAHLNKYDTKRLGEIARITKSIEPGSGAYQEEGVPFVRVSNLSKFEISQPDIYLDSVEYVDVIRPRKNTILLSKDGSVGIAYKVQADMNAITSGAILHLTITDEEFIPDYVTLVLNSIIVKMQAERDAGGSIIQHWKPSEIENVVIPKLDIELQKQIAEKIKESFALRAESKHLLELAKTAVEVAIEQGEEKGLELLN